MSVLINFKICDNVRECSGIDVCPNKALYWNQEKETIVWDKELCTLCGSCETACPVSAIHVIRTEEEEQRIKKNIEEDPRKISELFVDRYGAQPIDSTTLRSQDEFISQLPHLKGKVIVELFKDETIECLIKSLPLRDLFNTQILQFLKVKLTDNTLLEKFKLMEIPALLFFTEGSLIGKIEGYYSKDNSEELKSKVKALRF